MSCIGPGPNLSGAYAQPLAGLRVARPFPAAGILCAQPTQSGFPNDYK